jgi:hypothetical protein
VLDVEAWRLARLAVDAEAAVRAARSATYLTRFWLRAGLADVSGLHIKFVQGVKFM